jgi:hypothetical protein
MLGRLVLFVAGLVAAVAVLALPAGAHHKWGPYHWARTSNPFTLKVIDATNGWSTELNTAISDWSQSTVLDLAKERGTYDASCSPVAGKVKVCNGSFGDNGWLGIAQIWTSTKGHITQGTSTMNDWYFSQSPYNGAGWRQLVICQEPGHTLGLDHQDENFNNTNLGTCMDYTANPLGPPDNEHPNQHDYDQLAKIYSHLDSVNTVAASASTVGQMRRAGASDALWVQDLSDGGQLFTWVLWKNPNARHGAPRVP